MYPSILQTLLQWRDEWETLFHKEVITFDQCPNWALALKWYLFNNRYPTYRLKPKYITTERKPDISKPHIQIQLPMCWLYKIPIKETSWNLYDPKAPCPQWLLQKEGLKSSAISFSEPGVSAAPLLLHTDKNGVVWWRNHPNSPMQTLLSPKTQRHPGGYPDY